jgi:hypothetical protein
MVTLSLLFSAGLVSNGAGVAAAPKAHTGYRHEASIPAWARKYNMNCSGCHYPAVPRLNATGVRFRWAGYRMPEEIGEDAQAQQVSNYLAARARFRYVYEKIEGEPAEESNFELPDVSVFYAGALGKNLGGLLELAKEDDEVEFGAFVTGVWGNERAHGGFRAGQSHLLLGAGLAGFDRPIGIAAPTPVAGPVTSAIPFSYAGDQAGVEGFYVVGRNRVAAQLLGGSRFGEEEFGRGGKTKDFVLSDQFLIDKNGSGITGSVYLGSVSGVSESDPDESANFWRLALTASKVVGGFELLGGVVYGKDFDLPVGGTPVFAAADNRGYGYWVSGQYSFPESALTFFGRFEFVDPDTREDRNGNRRWVAGSVLPLNLPEYLRLALEFRQDRPQGPGVPKRANLAAEVLLSF